MNNVHEFPTTKVILREHVRTILANMANSPTAINDLNVGLARLVEAMDKNNYIRSKIVNLELRK